MSFDYFSNKKVALVHDWLNGMRGGEKCLEVLCEMFPHADLYTLLYEKQKVSPVIAQMNIFTSFIEQLPYGVEKYRNYLPFFPTAIERFELSKYDLIVSSSHCVAKGVPHDHTPFHLSYIHAPMRYMWNSFDTYFGKKSHTSLPVKVAARALRPYLQHWDQQSTDRVHEIVCNSKNIQQQIATAYQRKASVIYPPVDTSRFFPTHIKKNYYLIVSAFAPNKRIDLAIEAFNRLQLPLKIVGSGQDEAYCRSIAGATIEFLGTLEQDPLPQLYQEAQAFVFPGEDDLGITPLEAQASGTPVIAYAKGGALETVTKDTGIFFFEQTIDALCEAVMQIENGSQKISVQKCVEQAQTFNRERYRQEMQEVIFNGYQRWQQSKIRES